MWAAGDRARRGARAPLGFTLIEVLVILAILGLLAAIGFPAVDRAMRRQAFAEAASRLELALRGARASAVRGGAPVRFVIAADRRGFGYGGAMDRLPQDVRAAADAGIAFFPDGSASGGRVTLADGGWQRRWAVRPGTGAIERLP